MLFTPPTRDGEFVHEETVGVVPVSILGIVTVKVTLVNGQNSALSVGEIL